MGCAVWLVTACGIPTGSAAPNDNPPRGTLIASGTFTGASGQTASGIAEIYNNSGSYIARLNGITVTAETGLQIRVKTTTETVLSTALRSPQGTQNYTVGARFGTYAQVTIYSVRTNRDYAVANLVYTGQGS